MIAATAASPALATMNGRFRRMRCQMLGGRTPPIAGGSRVARSTAGCSTDDTGTSTRDGCVLERFFRLAMPAPVNHGPTLADVFGGRKVAGIHIADVGFPSWLRTLLRVVALRPLPCETLPRSTGYPAATSARRSADGHVCDRVDRCASGRWSRRTRRFRATTVTAL